MLLVLKQWTRLASSKNSIQFTEVFSLSNTLGLIQWEYVYGYKHKRKTPTCHSCWNNGHRSIENQQSVYKRNSLPKRIQPSSRIHNEGMFTVIKQALKKKIKHLHVICWNISSIENWLNRLSLIKKQKVILYLPNILELNCI
jgi:hypothetical protein